MLSREQVALRMIVALNRNEIPYVYLRNHESLPADVGNDVDLLVPSGRRAEVASVLTLSIESSGWRLFQTIEFGPLSLFFTNTEGSSFLHVDLFDRLEWHWIPFADTSDILSRRVWNGLVFHPTAHDEVYINIMTRLGYAGIIREKHRIQAQGLLETSGKQPVIDSWTRHMGSALGSRIGMKVSNHEWDDLLNATCRSRLSMRISLVSKRPISSGIGLIRYARRSFSRILNPPGPFIALEGADGVGKSTVIDSLYPLLKGITGRDDLLLFHWKPCRKSIRNVGDPAQHIQDPRLQGPRPIIASVFFLAYHWLGFWFGWIQFVLPSRIKNRACVADRYAWEFFLDPLRLRLNLPSWMLRLAARTVPSPTITLGLAADPSLVVSRKKELTESEIFLYQNRMREFASTNSRWVIIDAGKDIDTVIGATKSAIVDFTCDSIGYPNF